MKKIRLLIVDDSILFREYLKKNLSLMPSIEVVGHAVDPYEASKKIVELNPDVLTLDIEMPKMDGLTFLKKLMPQHPIAVIVISSRSGKVFEALNNGAVDFVPKPRKNDREDFITDLASKIKVASRAKIEKKRYTKDTSTKKEDEKVVNIKKDYILVGASTGGVEAFETILSGIDYDIPPMLLSQHMPEDFTNMYAKRLDKTYRFNVKEAVDGEYIEKNSIYVAPGDYHLKIRKKGSKYMIVTDKSPRVNGHRPSVDELFMSSINNGVEKSIGIILTGMGRDGAKGLLEMKKRNAVTIGQNEESSVVYGMPKEAANLGACNYVKDINFISQLIKKML